MARPEVLTDAVAEQIALEYGRGGVSMADLADRYGLGETTVWRVVKGKGKWAKAKIEAERNKTAERAAQRVSPEEERRIAESLTRLQEGLKSTGAPKPIVVNVGIGDKARELAERLSGRKIRMEGGDGET